MMYRCMNCGFIFVEGVIRPSRNPPYQKTVCPKCGSDAIRPLTIYEKWVRI